MRIYLIATGILLIGASCNSKKTTEQTTPVVQQDSNTRVANDSGVHTVSKDTVTAKTDLQSIDDLTLGMNQARTVALLGEADSKSKTEEWGADGLLHQDWFYKSKGITLNMSTEKEMSKQEIFSITITSPCTYKTNKGIGIGSTYKEVMLAYEKDIDKSASNKTTLTVGTIYGGIIFDFKNNITEKIFIGAAAE